MIMTCAAVGDLSTGRDGCVVFLISALLEKDFITGCTDDREGYSAHHRLGEEELKMIMLKTVLVNGAGGEFSSACASLRCFWLIVEVVGGDETVIRMYKVRLHPMMMN